MRADIHSELDNRMLTLLSYGSPSVLMRVFRVRSMIRDEAKADTGKDLHTLMLEKHRR